MLTKLEIIMWSIRCSFSELHVFEESRTLVAEECINFKSRLSLKAIRLLGREDSRLILRKDENNSQYLAFYTREECDDKSHDCRDYFNGNLVMPKEINKDE